MSALLESALDYAKRGWAVIPVHSAHNGQCTCRNPKCSSPGKHPRTKNGVKDATTDADQIKRLWKDCPNANIGIATGDVSGIVALDIDPKHGGNESFDDLESQYEKLPETVEVITGSNGRHLYFAKPKKAIRNSASQLGPGLDIRSDGGYVVAPPSTHISGKTYEWELSSQPDDVAVASIPQWLLEKLTKARKTTTSKQPSQSNVIEGSRNSTLASLAGTMRQRGMSVEALKAALHKENVARCHPPLSSQEVDAIAESIGRYTPGSDEGKSDKPTVAQDLIHIGEKATLFHDQFGEPFAAITEKGVRRVLPLRSRNFKRWFSGTYFCQTGNAAGSDAITNALNVLESKAIYEGDKKLLSTRFAESDNAIWVALFDEGQRAVKVTSSGWSVEQTPPILFRPHNHQHALPEPAKSGADAKLIFDFLNLSDDKEKVLILSWLVTSMIPNIPRPILILFGMEGSAKTTTGLLLRSLLDPSAAEVVTLSSSIPELAQTLDHHAVPLFDNLTNITPNQADMLCRAVTGSGFTKRALFTDADDYVMAFKRAILITAINIPTTAPDLLSRCLTIQLAQVEKAKRREMRDIDERFNRVKSRIVGGMYDLLSKALQIAPGLHIAEAPRMADFARYGAAVAKAAGYGEETFFQALFTNSEGRTEEILESHPVARALQTFMQDYKAWEGNATQLLDELSRIHGEPRRGDDWPSLHNQLTKRLRILQATLSEAGVAIEIPNSRGKRGRHIIITNLNSKNTPSTSSTAHLPQSQANKSVDDVDDQLSEPGVVQQVLSIFPEAEVISEGEKQ